MASIVPDHSLRMRESSTRNTPLPLSVELAYHRKCVAMKKRLDEIESTNDSARIRVQRLERSIVKLRTQRAMLMRQLNKRQNQSRDDLSERSSPPQSVGHGTLETNGPSAHLTEQCGQPRERMTHPRRSSTRAASIHEQRGASLQPPSADPARAAPSTYTPAQPAPPSFPPSPIAPHFGQAGPAAGPPMAMAMAPHAYGPPPPVIVLSAQQFPPGQLPQIDTLPNGTSVMLIAPGRPKPAPWTIMELAPKHQWNPAFNELPLELQEDELFENEYLPFDPYGVAIAIVWSELGSKYVQLARGERGWQDPVVDGVRQDDRQFKKRITQRLEARTAPAYRPGSRRSAEVEEYEREAEAREEASPRAARHM